MNKTDWSLDVDTGLMRIQGFQEEDYIESGGFPHGSPLVSTATLTTKLSTLG